MALALVPVLAGVVLWRDATAAQAALEAAREHIVVAQEQLGEGDASAAAAEVASARRQVDAALHRTDGPLWAFAEALPVVGRSPRIARRVVDVADAAVALADRAAGRADELLGEGGLGAALVGGDVDLDAVSSLSSVLDELPTARLVRTRDALADTDPSAVPASVREGRRQTLDLADRALRTLDQAAAATRVLPRFLGADGPRRYLLAMQNNAELRGTGGIIGLFTVVTVRDGKLSLDAPAAYSEVEDRLDDEELEPADAPPEFVDRYADIDALTFLNNVNVDPDLPTTAPVLLDLYAQRGGGAVDGLIALDPIALSYILEAIGPVDLPSALAVDERIPDPLPPEELPRVAMVEAYEVFGGETPERREFLEVLATRAFERITSGDWDAVAVGRQLGRAAGERHLQLYSRDPAEQADLEVMRIAGGLRGEGVTDVLAATANNAGANKQDVHVGHALTYDISLEVQEGTAPSAGAVAAERTVTTTIEVENPLPTTGMHEWIIGSAEPGRAFDEGLRGEPGLNRTWWTAWAPEGSRATAAVSTAGEAIGVRIGEIHDDVAVDHFLSTPSRSRAGWSVSMDGPVVLTREGQDLVYRVRLWRQSKAIPDDLTVRVAAPPGWRVSSADAEDRGLGTRLAMSADAVPEVGEPQLVLDDRSVRYQGEVSADVVLEVRFTRA